MYEETGEAAVRSLAEQPPDAALVAELLSADLEALGDFAVVEVVAAWRRVEALAAARAAWTRTR